jgi:hypothetical protein
MDIAFYGTNLNQSIILSQIGFAPKGLDPWDTLFKQALGNLILSVLGALPGYIGKLFLSTYKSTDNGYLIDTDDFQLLYSQWKYLAESPFSTWDSSSLAFCSLF